MWQSFPANNSSGNLISYYNSSSVCLFVCLCVCSLSPPRSFDGSSPNLVGVCRWTSHSPLRGSFPKRSTGRRVNGSLSLSTIIIYAPASSHTAEKGPFCFAAVLQSLSRRLLLHCISLSNCLVFVKSYSFTKAWRKTY